MARICTADDSKRGRAAIFNEPGVEARNLWRAAHIEIEISAPQLLDASSRLTGLEVAFNDDQALPIVGSDLFGDSVNDRNQIGIEHSKPDTGRLVREGGGRKWKNRSGNERVAPGDQGHATLPPPRASQYGTLMGVCVKMSLPIPHPHKSYSHRCRLWSYAVHAGYPVRVAISLSGAVA